MKYRNGYLLLYLLALLCVCREVFAQRRVGNKGGGVQRSYNRPMNGGATRTAPTRNLSGATRNTNNNTGNRTNINRNSNNTNVSGNTVNINVDRSRNVNVVNNNTVIRRNAIATYPRAPYIYGGRRYYCYHPYVYHPYYPYSWGPAWHPWGTFVAALAATALVVTVADAVYHYEEGVWYASSKGGYTAVAAPVGGTVNNIPTGAQTVVVNNTTNYYYGGTYYEKSGTQYKVVAPPAGAVVDKLPEGGKEVKIGDQTYVQVGSTFYQPVQVDGKNKYEVTQVEE